MRLFRVTFNIFAVLVGLALTNSSVFGAAIFFSTLGPPSSSPAGTPSASVVPELTLTAGQTGTLYVWITPDGIRGAGGNAPAQTFNNVAWNIETSNPAAATPASHVVVNPVDIDNDPATRWDGVNNGFPGTGNNWVLNAFGLSASSKSIGNSNVANTTFISDPEYHAASRSFFLGTLTFQATATPGGAGQRTGLYFRTGSSLNSLRSGATVGITFGDDSAVYTDTDGTSGGLGDPITGDLGFADAILNVTGVGGGGPTVSLTNHDGTDTTSGDADLVNSPLRTFMNIGPATSGRVNVVNYHGEPGGAMTLFFDLVNDAEAQGLVDALNGVAGGAFTASVRNFVGVNATTPGNNDGDIALVFPNRPAGSDSYIDFNFNGVQVKAVGVPEPSTYALAAFGALAFGLVRRNRRQG